MTSLVAWVGRDSRSLSSAYVATDSRISWQQHSTWDRGCKTFASRAFPDIFGYVGDVLMPATALSQFVVALDAGAYGDPEADQRLSMLAALIEAQVGELPSIGRVPFQVVHIARVGEGMKTRFRVGMTEFGTHSGTRHEVLEAPDASAKLLILGSGTDAVGERLGKWQRSEVAGTSRAIFGAFASSVGAGADPMTGGPVQLVGLRRKGSGRVLGVWHEGGRYVAGACVPWLDANADLEWFNERFERCDGQTGELIGQRQPVPGSMQ
jgi:hypothetical protein